MGAVYVGVGHDDNAVVAQLLWLVVFLAETTTKRRQQRDDLLGRNHLVEPGLFDVEHLAAQRQDRLELAVAALLGGTAGGIALDDIKLAKCRIFFLTVGELAGQSDVVEHAFAASHFARLACRFACTGCFNNFAGNDFGVSGFFQKEF